MLENKLQDAMEQKPYVDDGVRAFAYAFVISTCNEFFTCMRMIEKGRNSAAGIKDCKAHLEELKELMYRPNFKYYTFGSPALTPEALINEIEKRVEDKDAFPSDFKPFGEVDPVSYYQSLMM